MSETETPTNETVASSEPTQITIDGKTYKLADLSSEAQGQLRNIQQVDRTIVAAQAEIKAAQTWRTVHSHTLKVELDKMG